MADVKGDFNRQKSGKIVTHSDHIEQLFHSVVSTVLAVTGLIAASLIFGSKMDASTKPKSGYLRDSRENKTLRRVLSSTCCDLSGKSAWTWIIYSNPLG
jgi:hypothetical protein